MGAEENYNRVEDVPWRVPAETEPHERTWMAFGGSQRIWGRRFLERPLKNLILVANRIVEYEPVSVLVDEAFSSIASRCLCSEITRHACPLDDMWIRDTGPVFVVVAGRKAAVDFNFNGWGNKQSHRRDAQVARKVAELAGIPVIASDFVLEGWAMEADGDGTAILTESCVLNKNRNPGLSKTTCESKLKAKLGIEKILWLPGIAGKEITDGHTDFYVRFVRPGLVVAGYEPDPRCFDHRVTKSHVDLLKTFTDARGRDLKVQVSKLRGTCENNPSMRILLQDTSIFTCATERFSPLLSAMTVRMEKRPRLLENSFPVELWSC